MTDSTQEEPASLADDIEAAFAELENEEVVEQVNDVEETLETEEVIEPEDTSQVEAEEPTEEVGEDQETVDSAEEDVVSPPDHWSQSDKDVFSNAAPEIKDWLLSRHKSMEADYTRKTQGIADLKRDYEPVQQLLSPYAQNLRSAGLTPAQYIERLARADLAMTQDPMEGLRDIAKMYNVDLSQLSGNIEEEYTDPQYQAIQQELETLRGEVTQRKQAEAAERQNEIISDITKFSEAANEDGTPAHPYFDDVMEDMIALAQVERANGRTPVLQELYDKAVWANTSAREKMQAEKTAAQAKKSQEEARAKAARARKASSSVKGAPGSEVPIEDLSLREQISKQFG